jgi:hypothetical protein
MGVVMVIVMSVRVMRLRTGRTMRLGVRMRPVLARMVRARGGRRAEPRQTVTGRQKTLELERERRMEITKHRTASTRE